MFGVVAYSQAPMGLNLFDNEGRVSPRDANRCRRGTTVNVRTQEAIEVLAVGSAQEGWVSPRDAAR